MVEVDMKNRGEIVTILTIGTLIVLGLSTLISTRFINKNQQTTQSKAEGWRCPGGNCDKCGQSGPWVNDSGCSNSPNAPPGYQPPTDECPCNGGQGYCLNDHQWCGNDCKIHNDAIEIQTQCRLLSTPTPVLPTPTPTLPPAVSPDTATYCAIHPESARCSGNVSSPTLPPSPTEAPVPTAESSGNNSPCSRYPNSERCGGVEQPADISPISPPYGVFPNCGQPGWHYDTNGSQVCRPAPTVAPRIYNTAPGVEINGGKIQCCDNNGKCLVPLDPNQPITFCPNGYSQKNVVPPVVPVQPAKSCDFTSASQCQASGCRDCQICTDNATFRCLDIKPPTPTPATCVNCHKAPAAPTPTPPRTVIYVQGAKGETCVSYTDTPCIPSPHGPAVIPTRAPLIIPPTTTPSYPTTISPPTSGNFLQDIGNGLGAIGGRIERFLNPAPTPKPTPMPANPAGSCDINIDELWGLIKYQRRNPLCPPK